MVDMTNDVIRFEEMFADRFTEKDDEFMKLKSKSLPNPVVLYPWRTQRKVWNKRWDYGNSRNQDDRRDRGNYRNNERRGQDSYSRYNERRRDGENSRYRDRSHDGRQERHRDHGRSESKRDKEETYDYQAALKAYQER